MIVVIPFCEKDANAAFELLNWIKLLGGCATDCLIVTDAATQWSVCVDMLNASRGVFSNAELVTTDVSVNGWPFGANALWLKAAEECKKRNVNWLFLEPDAIPLKQGWFDAICTEYGNTSKPYMGYMYAGKTPGLPQRFMTGVAVYPARAYDDIGFHARGDKAWDVAAAKHMVDHGEDTSLIFQIWGEEGKPPTFAKHNTPHTNILCPEQIPTSAVLFHRNKDGTLINLLKKKYNLVQTCLVETGRYGDIINILPLAKMLAYRNGGTIAMVTSTDYASVIEGCSYIVSDPYPGRFEQIREAIDYAKKKYANVIVSQAYGFNWLVEKLTDSYAKESWRIAGYPTLFGTLPLIFDRRDKERELALVESVKTDKPMMLVNTSGNSSPANAFSDRLKQELRSRWESKFNIVDIGNIRADMIYDLLGLYEAARIIITTDTSTMHLLAATNTFNIQIYNPRPWYGTPIVGSNCILRISYDEVISKMMYVHEAISSTMLPEVAMVYSDYNPKDINTARRVNIAKSTYRIIKSIQPYWIWVAVKDSDLPRIFRDSKSSVPYVRDLIEKGLENVSDHGWIVMFNSDICLSKALANKVEEQIRLNRPFAVRRNEFRSISGIVPENTISKGITALGTDVFVFSKEWWKEHNMEMPDMLLAREGWDLVLSKIILSHGGDILTNLVCHEWHMSFWFQDANRLSINSQLYNISLARKFCSINGLDAGDYGLPFVCDFQPQSLHAMPSY